MCRKLLPYADSVNHLKSVVDASSGALVLGYKIVEEHLLVGILREVPGTILCQVTISASFTQPHFRHVLDTQYRSLLVSRVRLRRAWARLFNLIMWF
jgi:hypothetical protein